MQEALEELQNEDDFKIYLKMKTIERNYSNLQKEVNIDTDFELMLPDFIKFYGRKDFLYIKKISRNSI